MSSDKLYARVDDDGKVLEYPVFEIHIAARGQSVDAYTLVEIGEKPAIPEFYWMKETVVGRIDAKGGKHVNTSYSLVAYTLGQVLDTLKVPADEFGMGGGEPMNIADVPPATIGRVAVLATQYAQVRLDDFVKTRNYDDVKSAVTYKDSAIEKFSSEGTRAFNLRDQTWAALYTYLEQVTTGAVLVPIKVEDIEAILPALSWE